MLAVIRVADAPSFLEVSSAVLPDPLEPALLETSSGAELADSILFGAIELISPSGLLTL